MKTGYKKDGNIDLRRLPVIIERHLHRERAHGLAMQHIHHEAGERPLGTRPTLELDTATKGRKQLETAIHEALHLSCPFMYEKVVTQTARYIAMVLWKLNFRRIE